MAFRFCDSFDHYTTLTDKWTSYVVSGNKAFSVSATAKRTGIAGLLGQGPTTNGNGEYLRKQMDAQSTWILGVAYQLTQAPIHSHYILITWDGASVQGALGVDPAGTISLYRGSTVVATSSLALSQNAFYYVEFKHTVNSAGGTLEGRVNGQVWVTFTGNTAATANNTADGFGPALWQLSGSTNLYGTSYYDDFYALDGTDGTATQGVPNNTYWGDTRVECHVPTGAGTYQALTTLVGAATQLAAITEIPPDDATSYIGDSTVGNASTFTFPALSATFATIHAVQTLMRAANSDSGTGNFKRRVHISGADYDSADYGLGTGWLYYLDAMCKNPATGNQWLLSEVNALDLGVVVD